MSIYVRLIHRFGPRQMEWFMAVITSLWGAVLLLPSETFVRPAWAVFAAVNDNEAVWGLAMLAIGIVRIGGLIVNGARKEITPWIRVVSAGLGFLIWVGIVFGFSLTGVVSTWLAVYPTLAVAELVNIYRAGHDAGESNAAST